MAMEIVSSNRTNLATPFKRFKRWIDLSSGGWAIFWDPPHYGVQIKVYCKQRNQLCNMVQCSKQLSIRDLGGGNILWTEPNIDFLVWFGKYNTSWRLIKPAESEFLFTQVFTFIWHLTFMLNEAWRQIWSCSRLLVRFLVVTNPKFWLDVDFFEPKTQTQDCYRNFYAEQKIQRFSKFIMENFFKKFQIL
jgi:hypothetical protein